MVCSRENLDVVVIAGTRPEAIKMVPVIRALKKDTNLRSELWLTGQHAHMALPALDSFDEKADLILESPNPSGTLSGLTEILVRRLDEAFSKRSPKIVVVHGDTTSAFVAALVAYYHRIAVAHVEAGLRTGNKLAPFPEEGNRSLIAPLADLHFAPTTTSLDNLLREGVQKTKIHVTGNTVIDALLLMVEKVRKMRPALPENFPVESLAQGKRMVLITGHRRENFGDGFQQICEAIRELSAAFPEVTFVYPVHLNQNVQGPVKRILSGVQNIVLTEPLDYSAFVWAMDNSSFILSDSGGIQEEAPALGKPVLVMRDITERPEAIAAGTAKLVGADKARIVAEATRLLKDSDAYARMSQRQSPFGDGFSGARIAKIIAQEIDETC